MQKLTKEQIEQLYTFTRQHFVEWYDLQTELVDHLANAIEEQWQQNPKLTFDDALNIEFRKFGVFGFMDVVEKRQGALTRKYSKLVFKELKTFFFHSKNHNDLVGCGIGFLFVEVFPGKFPDHENRIYSFHAGLFCRPLDAFEKNQKE